jgi:hypothetical protein
LLTPATDNQSELVEALAAAGAWMNIETPTIKTTA